MPQGSKSSPRQISTMPQGSKDSTRQIMEGQESKSSLPKDQFASFIKDVKTLEDVSNRAEEILHSLNSENYARRNAAAYSLDEIYKQYDIALKNFEKYKDYNIPEFNDKYQKKKQLLDKLTDIKIKHQAKLSSVIVEQQSRDSQTNNFIHDVRELDKIYEQAKEQQKYLRSSKGYADVEDQLKGIKKYTAIVELYTKKLHDFIQYVNDDIPGFQAITDARVIDERLLLKVKDVHQNAALARQADVNVQGGEVIGEKGSFTFDPFDPHSNPFEAEYDLYNRKKGDDIPLNNERILSDLVTKMAKINEICAYSKKQVDKFQERNQHLSNRERALFNIVKTHMNVYQDAIIVGKKILKEMESLSMDPNEYQAQAKLLDNLTMIYNNRALKLNVMAGWNAYSPFTMPSVTRTCRDVNQAIQAFVTLSHNEGKFPKEVASSDKLTTYMSQYAQAIENGLDILKTMKQNQDVRYEDQNAKFTKLMDTYNRCAQGFNRLAGENRYTEFNKESLLGDTKTLSTPPEEPSSANVTSKPPQ